MLFFGSSFCTASSLQGFYWRISRNKTDIYYSISLILQRFLRILLQMTPKPELLFYVFASLLIPLIQPFSACGNENAGKGGYAGMSTCQDLEERFHFRVFVPPWKHVREYQCDDGDFRRCNLWTPTGRFVFVVSDSPFVSFDSEIITSLTFEERNSTGSREVEKLLKEIAADADAALDPFSDEEDVQIHETLEGLKVYDVYWKQIRLFEDRVYDWHRRDSFIETGQGRLYHLEFFSLFTLKKPEFDLLVRSFALGPASNGAPRCNCMDERAVPPEPCI